MRIIISITVLFLCFSLSVWGQANKQLQANYLEITSYDGNRMSIQNRLDNKYNTVKGSPFLNEAWSDGRIMLINDSVGAELKMRFNVYGNEMQFIDGADTLIITNPMRLHALWLDGRRFEYLPYRTGTSEKATYFEVLITGKVKLLLRHSCRLQKGSTDVTPYSSGVTDDQFVPEKSYYYQNIDMETAGELPLVRKGFISIPEFSIPEVEEFMKAKKIKLRDEKDLITLFTWINQLPQVK